MMNTAFRMENKASIKLCALGHTSQHLLLKISTAYRPLGASQVAPVVPPANTGDSRKAGWMPGSGRPPEEGTAAHPSILAWRIPWTEEPGGLQSVGCQESDTTEATVHACTGHWDSARPLPSLLVAREQGLSPPGTD